MMTRWWILAAVGMAAVLSAGRAEAFAGSPKEKNLYQAYTAQSGRFVCPAGTKRIVQEGERGLEEGCVSRDGTRHGYYIRWHDNSDRWAVLGQYRNGKRVGRWIRFNKRGRKRGTMKYRGRIALRTQSARPQG